MSFDWREYLELARELAGMEVKSYSPEARYRSSVSRAYYAAFCWTRNYAEQNLGFHSNNIAEDHKSLREHLKRHQQANIASNLNQLRFFRNRCDYDDRESHVDQLAKNSIKLAEKIIHQLR